MNQLARCLFSRNSWNLSRQTKRTRSLGEIDLNVVNQNTALIIGQWNKWFKRRSNLELASVAFSRAIELRKLSWQRWWTYVVHDADERERRRVDVHVRYVTAQNHGLRTGHVQVESVNRGAGARRDLTVSLVFVSRHKNNRKHEHSAMNDGAGSSSATQSTRFIRRRGRRVRKHIVGLATVITQLFVTTVMKHCDEALSEMCH